MGRALSIAELQFLERYFGDTLQTAPIRLGLTIGRRCWSPYGNRISLTRGCFEAGDPNASVRLDEPHVAATLAHEAMHVWQRQHRTWVTLHGAVLQTGYVLRIADPYHYEPSLDPDVMLERFEMGNIERQGRIVEDYVFAQHTAQDVAPFAAIARRLRGG